MKSKQLNKVDDLYDIYAIRIIVKDLKECYELL
jgi:(p)ppGpp synthase/HD superfamily hydrolase